MQVHTCYRIAKGSEISVYCRVCTKPSSPSYLKKGMLPCLQGTIKLKAVSRLFGRTPRMQGRSAWAERPVCRHISATLLTLQVSWFSFPDPILRENTSLLNYTLESLLCIILFQRFLLGMPLLLFHVSPTLACVLSALVSLASSMVLGL